MKLSDYIKKLLSDLESISKEHTMEGEAIFEIEVCLDEKYNVVKQSGNKIKFKLFLND